MTLPGNSEDARVEKPDGTSVGPYKASFAGSTIFMIPEADIAEGDAILRQLPNGKVERSIVTQATFSDIGPLGPHYQLKFRKGAEAPAHKTAQNITIGNAGSVQIGDYNTQNIVNSFEALVKRIESSNATDAEKAEAKGHLKKLLEHPLIVSILGSAVGAILSA